MLYADRKTSPHGDTAEIKKVLRMFSTLKVAERAGAIQFEWTDSCVIVSTPLSFDGPCTPVALILVEAGLDSHYRRELEHLIAADLRVIR